MHATNHNGNNGVTIQYVEQTRPGVIALVELISGHRFEIYRNEASMSFIVLAPWNGTQTYITYEQAANGTDAFTVALRAALEAGQRERFIDPVVIDNTNLFMPRLFIDRQEEPCR